RIKNPAAAHAHDFAARETVAAEKRNPSRARRHLTGVEFSRAPERDRRAQKTRAGAKGSRVADRADRGGDQEDRGATRDERERAGRGDGEIGSGKETDPPASQRSQKRGRSLRT